MPQNDLLLRTLRRERTPRAPVWLMRQAGRTDPEYHALRQRSPRDLHAFFRSPSDAVRISLLPQRIGVDAIIMFQDILTPLSPMGVDFHFAPGPVLQEACATPTHWQALRPYQISQHLGFIGQSIEGILEALKDALPLLGFAGAPFTLAAFLIAGKSPGMNLGQTIGLVRRQPQAFERLMDKLTQMTIDYLGYQVQNGVHAVQLFESVGGAVPHDLYEQFVQPSHQRIFASLPQSMPSILFVREGLAVEKMAQTGAIAISVGAQLTLPEVWEKTGGACVLQGNVDNQWLAGAKPDEIEGTVHACLQSMQGKAHILNLSHGLLPQTPFENVQHFVRAAKNWPQP